MADPCPTCGAPTRDGVHRNDALLTVTREKGMLDVLLKNANEHHNNVLRSNQWLSRRDAIRTLELIKLNAACARKNHAIKRLRAERDKLLALLRRADALVIWGHNPGMVASEPDFQATVEKALGRGKP